MRRGFALALVACAHALAIWVLVRPMTVARPPADTAMVLVNIAEPPPPPVADAAPEAEGASAPPAPAARPPAASPRPVAAPKPDTVVPPPEPNPAPMAPLEGVEQLAGAAPLNKGGTAAGGDGTGAGLGTAGTGAGGGGITRARRIAGDTRRADFPRARPSRQLGGSATAHFDVGTDGRVRNCRIVRTSGSAERDATLCRLIVDRFRYEPARDARGTAVPDVAGWRQDWWPDG